MEKVIKIGDKDVKMRTSAATPRLYRDLFKRDVFKDMAVLWENQDNITYDMFELVENFAYLCAKCAGEKVPDTVAEWLDQFEGLDVMDKADQIIGLWIQENETQSKAKKAKGQ